MLEFTGERVIPGQVDPDLWNEHYARYLFAARLGYGAAELARSASSVAAIDISAEAIALAEAAYAAPNLSFRAASATALPFETASFDLKTCFEVIEHLDDWRALLAEAKRLLAAGGQFIVSTPNRTYYAEARAKIGPNPFHAHEFDFEEFQSELSIFFSSVTLYVQNHVGALSFQPVAPVHPQSAELHIDTATGDPHDAHFFLAVCAGSPQTGAPAFLHLPATTNVLRERESHIHKLEHELLLKNKWLEQSQYDHTALLNTFQAQTAEMQAAQQWARTEHSAFEAARAELQQTCEQYERRLAAQERTFAGHLESMNREVQSAQEAMHAERLQRETAVAQRNEAVLETERLKAMLAMIRESRWVKLGRRINIGPDIQDV